MRLQTFIDNNRSQLVESIGQVLNFVPKSASCNCPRVGTDHSHEYANNLTNDEIEGWIMNDEGLYNWARGEGVRI